MEAFKASSRIYDEINGNGATMTSKDLDDMSEVLKEIGIHVKKISLKDASINRNDLIKLLGLLPNLETLIMVNVEEDATDPQNQLTVQQNVTLPKLKTIRFNYCKPEFKDFINDLLGCFITEANIKLSCRNVSYIQSISIFLQKHQGSLKNLNLRMRIFDQVKNNNNMSWDFEEMRLEHLDLRWEEMKTSNESFLKFLRQNRNLKFLRLSDVELNNRTLKEICDHLTDLQTLEFQCEFNTTTNDACENLYKLKNLKRLWFNNYLDYNALSGLKFGINKNLEELRAFFDYASSEFITELKSCIPNLRVLDVCTRQNTTIENVLNNFENLEFLSIYYENIIECLKISTNQTLPKLRNLKIVKYFESNLVMEDASTETMVQHMYNLEYLWIYSSKEISCSCLVILLRGLKNLKELHLDYDEDFGEEMFNVINLNRQSSLQKFYVGCLLEKEIVVEKLKDCKGLEFGCKNFSIII